MKRVIRQGVFESNSSSQHSISVMKKSEYYTTDEIMKDIYLYNDGSWHFWEHDMIFERSPFRCLATFKDKFIYTLAALTEYRDDTYNKLESIALKYVSGLTQLVMPTNVNSCPVADSNSDSDYVKEYGKTEDELAEMLMEKEEKYGIEIAYWTNDDNTHWYYELPYTGYAQDYGILSSFLKEKKIGLEEFLINKKYIIIVDGDESNIWGELKQSGLINTYAIDYEY